MTILGVPACAQVGRPQTAAAAAKSTPGVATQRIDGPAKVAGQKIFARDFNARDMPGWGPDQWYALYLHALTTDHAFLGLDLSGLPEPAKPTRVVLGNELSQGQRLPKFVRHRDSIVEEETASQEAKLKARMLAANPSGTFNRPSGLEFDLIVQPGNVPNFLGQAVGLLMFDSAAGYRAAKRFMQFRDADFQIYQLDAGPSVLMDTPYSPQTTYVKYDENGETFSYATADPNTYMQQVPAYRDKISTVLKANPQFVQQDFEIDTQAMDPMFMEPESGLVWYDSAKQTLNILLGTQSPDGDVDDILSMYGEKDSPLHPREIVLNSCYPGGGFGGRDSSPFSLMLALTAPYSGNRPVKLMYDRFEQFRSGLKRPGVKIQGRLVVAPDKQLQLVEMTLNFDGGGLKNLSPYVANLAALCAGGSYRFPMADIFAQSIHTQNIPGGSQRGFGGPEAFLTVETAIDEIAVKQNWDPVALRRANILDAAGITVVGGPIAQELRLSEMLDRAEAHPLWAKRADIKAAYAARGQTYGTGFAMSLQAYGTSGDGMVAAVKIGPDGRLTVQSDAVDMGNGSATTLGVAIGEFLGANADTVVMGGYTLFGQTGLTTSDPGNLRWQDPNWTAKGVGSSSACLTGLHQVHTVQQTARALFEIGLMPVARQIWGLPGLKSAETEWAGGLLRLKTGTRPAISLQEFGSRIHAGNGPSGTLGHAYFQSSWAEADYPLPDGTVRFLLDGLSYYVPGSEAPIQIKRSNTQGPGTLSKRFSRYVWAPCVNVVGLTVDKSNGRVQVENVATILNAGRIYVPELVSGQSQGGVAMAIGYTLLENMPDGMVGPANGTWNLNRYHVPHTQDVPLLASYVPGGRSQELIIMPETPGDNRAGRGIAEAVMCSIAPAISNGLRDAVGRRYTSLPITPEKILKGLAQ